MSLVEGNSIASTCRMTGAAKMTVLSLLKEVGVACQRFHDFRVRLLDTTKVQADEAWSFCYAKGKNLPEGLCGKIGFGSIWTGEPKEENISTSYMERWNLTLRMQNRRFTRLTNGFSKKFENHRHMLALMVTHYNFCRKHASLKGEDSGDGGRYHRLGVDGCRSALARHVGSAQSGVDCAMRLTGGCSGEGRHADSITQFDSRSRKGRLAKPSGCLQNSTSGQLALRSLVWHVGPRTPVTTSPSN